jgi:hypothetical protein
MIGVLNNTNSNELPEELIANGLEEIHKTIWANNGDALSMAYTGTGALKSQLTRTGKLTLTGLVDDSVKTMKRTYQNNFSDNKKQEIIDLFLGTQSIIEEFQEEKDWLNSQLKSRQIEFSTQNNLNIFIGTWNVNGHNTSLSSVSTENLEEWLGLGISQNNIIPDIYVIGFQEVVSLTGKSVWNADESNMLAWQKTILQFIRRHYKFILLRSYQLVGIVLCVFVREDQISKFRDVQSEICKVGFKGIAGNKGAISIRFNYDNESFCFTCSHLAAGQNKVDFRNKDYNDVIAGTIFRTSKGTLSILDHE